jgi:hypothetical protein
MSKTRWAVDGPDNTIEVNGRRFAPNDDGAPMMCNLICQAMGRHAHIDNCRATDGSSCQGAEVQHIRTRMHPNPDLAKDWITHRLYWGRSGAITYSESEIHLTLPIAGFKGQDGPIPASPS